MKGYRVFPAKPGTYLLIFRSQRQKQVKVGQLGTISLYPGFYLYVGSAFGLGGLAARIRHHLVFSEKPHWHIDYVRPYLKLERICYFLEEKQEHRWAKKLTSEPGVRLPLIGFGSSDCHCASHFFFTPCRRVVFRIAQSSGGYLWVS
ncbi:MAG: GIY-YIG nuclease family protein [Candidatus Omnitrophica bacterium]|nr:GIY-YIG nuclease family protein [Candidatus Omnitrophota bacterium]